VAHKFAKFGI